MPAAAVVAVGTALVGAYTANKQSKAVKSAANTQARSADNASQVQWDMFNRATQLNEPFRQGGLTGLQEYMQFLGLPTSSVTNATTAQQSAMSPSGAIEWFDPNSRVPVADPESYRNDPLYKRAWDEVWAYHKGRFDKTSDRAALGNHLQSIYDRQRAAQQTATPATGAATTGGGALTPQQITNKLRATPGYQFAFNEGQRALESSAAARGGLFSGAAAKALTKYGQGVADQQYGTHLNRLAGLAGLAQTATNQTNQLGMATANNVGQNMMNAGAARASGINGSADAWSGFAGGLTGLAGLALGRNGGNWGWGGV